MISVVVLLLSVKSLKRSKEREKNRRIRQDSLNQIEKRMDELSDDKQEYHE